MPNPGVVNNPGGSNSYGSNGVEEPQGAIERRKVLTAMAPPAGGAIAAAAKNAPKRAQRASQKKGKPMPNQVEAVQQQQMAPSAPIQQSGLVSFWTSLAAEPGASPLVKQYAAEVTGGSGTA